MKFLIIIVFIFFLTGCAAKVSTEKEKIFGASASSITVQYIDESGSAVANKKR